MNAGPTSFKAVHIAIVAPSRSDAGRWRAQLEASSSRFEVRTWTSAEEALRELRRSKTDILVCELSLVDWDGLDLLLAVRRRNLAIRTVAMLDRQCERDLELLGKCPVAHAVTRFDLEPAQFSRVIDQANNGGTYLDDSFVELVRRQQRLAESYSNKLTPSEVRVLAFAGSALDDKEVARALGISVSTAHTHRRRAMQKLGLHSQLEIVGYAARKGLVRYASERVLRPGFDVAALEATGT